MRKARAVVAWALFVLALGMVLATAFDVFIFKHLGAVAFHACAALVLTLAFCAYAFLALRN